MKAFEQDSAGVPVRAVMPHLSQPKHGYRYSTDAVVLGAFAAEQPTASWVDLGTGCGVIAFRLARAWPQSEGLAVDRVEEVIHHARINLQQESVSVVHGDLRGFPFREHSFDLAVCNPPFFDAHAFRPSKNPGKRAARHAHHGDIVAFATRIKRSLQEQGRFCFVFPIELAEEKHKAISNLGYYLRRRLVFRSFREAPAHGVCLEYKFKPGMVKEESLTLFQKSGFYTHNAWDFLNFRN